MAEYKHPDFYDAFISYRHESKSFFIARLINNKLVQDGYSVFIDKNMENGHYKDIIKGAIGLTRNFIIVLSPGDLDDCRKDGDWLTMEAEWAYEVPNMNVYPVMTSDFVWPDDDKLSDSLLKAKGCQGIRVHTDESMDERLDHMCEKGLLNTDPVRPVVTTEEFYDCILKRRDGVSVKEVDMAFHAGAQWVLAGKKLSILKELISRGVRVRVVINTPEAAESIGRYMRDDIAGYTSFETSRDLWRRISEKYGDLIEVRECDIPLIHVFHRVNYTDGFGKNLSKMHVKYYVYDNPLLDNAFEHDINGTSRYYDVYSTEFEFLWSRSKKV